MIWAATDAKNRTPLLWGLPPGGGSPALPPVVFLSFPEQGFILGHGGGGEGREGETQPLLSRYTRVDRQIRVALLITLGGPGRKLAAACLANHIWRQTERWHLSWPKLVFGFQSAFNVLMGLILSLLEIKTFSPTLMLFTSQTTICCSNQRQERILMK